MISGICPRNNHHTRRFLIETVNDSGAKGMSHVLDLGSHPHQRIGQRFCSSSCTRMSNNSGWFVDCNQRMIFVKNFQRQRPGLDGLRFYAGLLKFCAHRIACMEFSGWSGRLPVYLNRTLLNLFLNRGAAFRRQVMNQKNVQSDSGFGIRNKKGSLLHESARLDRR